MKLVDILARELTEWPVSSCMAVTQEENQELYFFASHNDACFDGFSCWIAENNSQYSKPKTFCQLADDWRSAVVKKSEWKSARAAYLASIQPARDPEIAAVVDKPANPWRRNRGRKTPPVPQGVIVDYKLRDDVTCYSDLAEALTWEIEGMGGDIMQWRYAEPQQEQDKPMAQTIEQVIENAEAAAAAAFNPIALRDEYKRITLECEERSQQMRKLTDRMGDIEAALRAEGFALIDTEGK